MLPMCGSAEEIFAGNEFVKYGLLNQLRLHRDTSSSRKQLLLNQYLRNDHEYTSCPA
jgi:hypothetical protein